MRLNILSFLYTTLCWAAAVSLRLYRELKPWITLALLYARSLLLFLCRDYLLFSSVPPSPASSPQVYACSLISTVHFLRPTSATVSSVSFHGFKRARHENKFVSNLLLLASLSTVFSLPVVCQWECSWEPWPAP